MQRRCRTSTVAWTTVKAVAKSIGAATPEVVAVGRPIRGWRCVAVLMVVLVGVCCGDAHDRACGDTRDDDDDGPTGRWVEARCDDITHDSANGCGGGQGIDGT
jgi:hypothetical protein